MRIVPILGSIFRVRAKSLQMGIAQGEDNFLLLRLIAASLVIYGHAPAISGMEGPPDLFADLGWWGYSGSIAVDLFFITSGFLIAGSYIRNSKVLDFIWARFLRIIPAYVACLVLMAFVLGPIFTNLPLNAYISSQATRNYVVTNLKFVTGLSYWLPGVFNSHPRETAVNGSIWTLPAEVRMYLWVACLGVISVLARRWLSNVVIIGIFIYAMHNPDSVPLVPMSQYLRLAALFACGALCYVNRDWIPVDGRLFLVVCALTFLFRNTTAYPWLFGFCEIQFVFWFAYNTAWRGFNRFGDYSYGIYLWGFPMQQVVEDLFPNLPVLLNALLGLALTIPIAIASWHFIEKPALRLKELSRKLRGLVSRRNSLRTQAM
ncbi:acyltransferase family protein [Dyella psychrodurans]|uniref:Acyltransferase n=1 Tax=Dyella psychrodurans TaxID=1927960 RepID=A0A370WY74_9GAMM|nr:acyltransferase [Dyella psychrodurans]RDS80987.1 acyltransferase [Dyella psychrodurans]